MGQTPKFHQRLRIITIGPEEGKRRCVQSSKVELKIGVTGDIWYWFKYQVALRDRFGHQRLREGVYTPGEIDRKWSEEFGYPSTDQQITSFELRHADSDIAKCGPGESEVRTDERNASSTSGYLTMPGALGNRAWENIDLTFYSATKHYLLC